MGKLIQVHDVPDEVHAELRRQAALSGMSLSAFLREELTRLSGKPPIDEVLARIAERNEREPVSVEPGEIERSIREMRGPLPPLEDDV